MMPFETLTTLSGIACIIDPVDVRDLVIAGVDRFERPHADGNVAVDVQPELVRLGGGCGQPVRVERAVELHAGEAILLRLATSAIASASLVATLAACAVYGALAVDERRGIHVREQQFARGRALASIDRRESSLPGSRTDVTPIDSSCSPVKSSPTCMWQSQRPGNSVLPRPSMTCAPAGTFDDARPRRRDLALVDDHRLIGQETLRRRRRHAHS